MAEAVLAAAVSAAAAEDAAAEGDTAANPLSEINVMEASNVDNVIQDDFQAYAKAIAIDLCRNHEEVRQAIVSFAEHCATLPPSAEATASNFAPFDFRVSDTDVERVIVEMSIKRSADAFQVVYLCRASTLSSDPRSGEDAAAALEAELLQEKDQGQRTALEDDLHFETSPGPSSGEASKAGRQRKQSGQADDWLLERRAELNRFGVVKWELEKGVPDVGGIGWRTKAGHPLKNQTYYSGALKQNLWDNPTHAGPKTWKDWHGPRLRTDAPLLEKMDRLDVAQQEFEARKQYVNTVRIQTLDRMAQRKIENEQREVAASWAPHRKAKREAHRTYDVFTAELDSMPVKELKKVLTPCVLNGDRNAIRNITQRVQTEETWKMAWKQLEKSRRDDTRSDFEHRVAYNALLMDLAGQPRAQRDPNRRIPNSCTPRLEEMSKPREPPGPGRGDVTQLTEYRGLVHADHQHALEARFPGYGHELATQFRQRVTAAAKASWPPPPRAETPRADKKRKTVGTGALSIERKSVPASSIRLAAVMHREDQHVASYSSHQFQATKAPPAPEQRKTLMAEAITADPTQRLEDYSPRTDTSTRRSLVAGLALSSPQASVDRAGSLTTSSLMNVAPPTRSYVYPVLAPTAEASAKRPTASADPRRRRKVEREAAATAAAGTAGSAELSRHLLQVGASGPHSARGPGPRRLAATAAASVGESVGQDLDNFQANLRTIPHVGNFWMASRWKGRTDYAGGLGSDSEGELPQTAAPQAA